VVLFGGAAEQGRNTRLFADTWTWDGTTWMQQTPAVHPSAREFASMADDPATGTVVLFGGGNQGREFADTWTWG
jgi:hypothetical protein